MKAIRTLKKLTGILCLTCFLFQDPSYGQVCSNPGGIIYGLGQDGNIYPINTSNAAVSPKINPAYTGNPPASPNAMGWDPSSRKFYYFKRNADQSPQEFVSFNTITNTYSALPSCPTTNNIKTGCVNFNSTGYYCIDANANLYFFRFASGMWRLITSRFYNQFGADITSVLATHSSGDIAMDGFGQLWFLCSDAGTYGLYRFPMPIPTTTVASMTLTQRIPPTTPTPTGVTFAGIAFSPTGQIYLSQYGGDRFYRLNNNNTLSFLGTFTISGVGTDLTSCNYPMTVLASTWQNFVVETKGNQQALLSWTVFNENSRGYFIEYSADAENWKTLAFIESNGNEIDLVKYTYNNYLNTNGRHYYRIRQVGQDGQYSYSSIKFIDIKIDELISVGPNPTKGTFRINNSLNLFSRISILDLAGKVLKESTLSKGMNSIALTAYPPGTYMIRMQSEAGQTYNQKIIKE